MITEKYAKLSKASHYSLLSTVDLIRLTSANRLDPTRKGELGQYYTPASISLFMASMFRHHPKKIKLLDPGCGIGMLFAAFTEEVIRRKKCDSLEIDAFEVEPNIQDLLDDTIKCCTEVAAKSGVELHTNLVKKDFIRKGISDAYKSTARYTHAILNPPYKKINNDSEHRLLLQQLGVDVVNLYAAFVVLAIELLKDGGEIVAIIPRSFCNGSYYLPFRKFLLDKLCIHHLHIFNSRTNAFQDDQVLQENIIIHGIKGQKQEKVLLTTTTGSDFHFDHETEQVTASDLTIREINFGSLVYPNDDQSIIHFATSENDQEVLDYMSCFTTTLDGLGLNVSTGPVVDFRMRSDLKVTQTIDSVPLLYPQNLTGKITWPLTNPKKPNYISLTEHSRPWLWENTGAYVLIRRFSSKEEKRRIHVSIYDGKLPFKFIGFENKLNVIHNMKKGIQMPLAKGLYVYLNSSLLDRYYRHFGGHTQVNATDLKVLKYPSLDSLLRMGKFVTRVPLSQTEIDKILEEEIQLLSGNVNNPLMAQNKVTEALTVLKELGLPRQQLNERSALTLLALLNLTPGKQWSDAESPIIGVTPIMEWCRDVYGKQYAPNTRETFRRQTLHQFEEAGLILYNPDKPDRPVNSPKACYQIVPELLQVLKKFSANDWQKALTAFLEKQPALVEHYAKAREMHMVDVILESGEAIKISPGAHSLLIKQIIEGFAPRFVPGAILIYFGETEIKDRLYDSKTLRELGIELDRHGKLPDVIFYYKKKNWLVLVEAVTSHGPMDFKRHLELQKLFKDSKAGIVYVTAFPNRKTMVDYLSDISWETEVWIADAPTHMIHFNGDKFLGPHS